ncbi:Gamma adaptin [Spironucleus salmonicida]|uniref:Adaptin n=1 Tax=Spironucleus salmonicida TaxID=348837 RepID=V6LPB8_9EUKA|nr:Gamma adaptin [Spironucleus salmonicida]|eukprot:EST46455.1 Adaptin [Spironucleus salmonicida]
MSISCDELIKRVRASKSSNQEYHVIQDELAVIRTSLKQKDQQNQSVNISKLIYSSMVGHNVSWGEMAIVNLCQSAKNHKEKRLAYLAMAMIPHDNDMYITMTCNTIKQDLESNVKTRQQIAIVALAQIGTADMFSELSESIKICLKEGTSYSLHKKALIAALKTIQLCPDIAESFVDPCLDAVNSKVHSVCMTGCELGIELLRCVPSSINLFSNKFQHFVGVLQRLSSPKYQSVDHDIGGVSDPFLQAAIIRFVSELTLKVDKQFIDCVKLSEVLEQIVTTGYKNGERVTARIALIFECSKAIMRLPEVIFEGNEVLLQNLRASAADSLTQSLDHKNQSVRYSALASIVQIIQRTGESQGVQRNRDIILNCMEESSVTLRRRALNLLVLISDSQSAEIIIQRLLNLIGKSQDGRYYILQDALNEDIRQEIVSSVAFIAEMFSTDPKWEFEVYVKCLQLCGPTKINKDLVSQITSLVSREKKLEQQAHDTFSAILTSTLTEQTLLYNESLISASLYIIGELAVLVQSPIEIINVIYNIVEGSIQSQLLVKYSVSTLAKFIVKSKSPCEQAHQLLSSLMKSYDPEVQQRACEYFLSIRNPKAAGILGKIPPPPKAVSKIQITEGSKRVVPQVVAQVVPQVISQQIIQQQVILPQQQIQQIIPNQQIQQIVPQQIIPLQMIPNIPVVPMQAPTRGNFANIQPTSKQPFLPKSEPRITPQSDVSRKITPPVEDLLDLMPQEPQKPLIIQQKVNLLEDIMGLNQSQNLNKLVFENQFVKIFTRARKTEKGVEVQFLYTNVSTDVKLKALYAGHTGVQVISDVASGQNLSSGKNITQKINMIGDKFGIKIKLSLFINGVSKQEMVTIDNVLE